MQLPHDHDRDGPDYRGKYRFNYHTIVDTMVP
jgi:hypothetical protein